MPLYARTLDDKFAGTPYHRLDLPGRTFEVCVVQDGVEPGGDFDLIIAELPEGGISIRLRDGQLLVASKATNLVEVLGVPWGKVRHGHGRQEQRNDEGTGE